ncbi:NAD(P)/FAD-dependent oxidoreductase [Streptomyces sp. R302]|uniref:phytoene desaturase family protein n=1 Tax=unclassified Streptomyces TaxID=2593676 RepID=UPI00145CBB19|nr:MULTISPECIES: NAD(P)/FAD-dependent oxidoreductase [unclassified Streptomyces]NML51734.1 NAD(P)/FAD-dependent oxidoreductase [Streptomyces sp. R301]NML81354.1 NAD(P)/FAD-dependent oxidoreductase [Streptomyces sp. R302]
MPTPRVPRRPRDRNRRPEGAEATRGVLVGRAPAPGEVGDAYDAVVIGSGVGGLTTAVCLARQGRRVAVFEQHYTAGGYTHAYRRRGWEWDVGIHYVGQLAPREPVRVVSDYLTGGALRWAPLGDPYDEYRLGGEVHRAPVGFAAYQAGLIERFPAERAGIEALFKLVARCRATLPVLALGRLSGPVARRLAGLLRPAAVPPEALRPAREVVAGLVRDERLRQAVLTPSVLLLADSSSKLPFFLVAVLFEHFRTGAWYPVGGSAAIARAMVDPIRAAGGEVYVRTPVERIELDGTRATGVVLADGTRVRAPVVVSAVGAHHTYRTLLPSRSASDAPTAPVRADPVRGLREGFPFVLLFLGLDGDPEELGLPRHNLMVTDGDCDAFFDGTGGHTSGLFLSFSSAKDPTWTARYPGRSTGEILAYVDPDLFAPFHGSHWHDRDPAYLALKAELTGRLLDRLYLHLPRTRGRVAYHELGTPLTAEHFTRWPGGSLYGLAKDVAAFGDGTRPGLADRLRPRTEFDGLYLSGQDVLAGGFLGAATGGLLAAHEALDRPGRSRLWRSLLKHVVRPEAAG